MVPAKAGVRRPSSRRICIIKKRKAALGKKKALEILTEDEDDYEQPGYDTDSDPGHRPLGKGPRSPPGGGEGANEAVVYSFEDTMVVPRRRPPCRLSWTVAPATM